MSTPQTPAQLLPDAGAPPPEQGIDLLRVVIAILSEWRIAVVTSLLAAIACFLYISSLKPQYVAKCSFLPQEGRSEGGSLASLFSNRGPGALYIGLLQSQTVENEVIEHVHLMQLFHANSMETARDTLAGISTFAEGADGIVTVSVRNGSAQNAAQVANAYLDALHTLNETMGLQQSSQTTAFFQKQLDAERDQLANAEAALANTQKSTHILSEAQTSIGLGAIQATREQITGLQVRRAQLLQSETEQNPEVQRVTAQIAELSGAEARLEGSGSTPLGAATPAGQVPEANLEIVRAQRAVKYHEVLVNSLATQFEAARLNEAFARSAFQVVDNAVAPEHKAWPPRKPYFIIALVFSALLGAIAVAAKLTVRRLLNDPEHRADLVRLRQAFGRR